jgi:hypothetical protein
MKPVLYTCIAGDRDKIPPLPVVSPGLDHVLYIDHEDLGDQDPGAWEIRPLLFRHPTDPVRTARWHKHHPIECFPHPRSLSIWMDATHWPAIDIAWMPEWFLRDAPVACFPHFVRSSTLAEANEVVRTSIDNPRIVHAQMDRYREAGFLGGAADRRLFDTCITMRRHGPRTRSLQDLWCHEIDNGSRRDQLSFTYCLWRLNLPCETIVPGHSRHPQQPIKKRGSPYFDWKYHPAQIWEPCQTPSLSPSSSPSSSALT